MHSSRLWQKHHLKGGTKTITLFCVSLIRKCQPHLRVGLAVRLLRSQVLKSGPPMRNKTNLT